MKEMNDFINRLLSLVQWDTNNKLTVSSIQKIITEINSFLYTKSGEIEKN